MKRCVKASAEMEYTGNVTFAGYIGSDTEFTVYAEDESEAEELISEEAAAELTVEDVSQTDESEWEVTIGFAGFIGIEETYTVYEDTEDEAIEAALEEARADLEVEFI